MSDVSGVHHVGLTVSDLARSVAFYSDALECEPIVSQEKQGGYLAEVVGYPDAHVSMCHLRAPGGQVVLELFEYHAPETLTSSLEPRRVGNAHICFLTPDLDRVYERARAAGATCISGPVDIDTGANAGGRALYMRDPDGIFVELFQKPPARVEGGN